MNIVTVYPIMRGAFRDELTYWSSFDFVPGTIIEVPLRGRTIPALVGTVSPASHAKANIKQASYMTRKIEKISEKMVVLPACIRACEKISSYYIEPLGTVLKACIPDAILTSPHFGKSDTEKILSEKDNAHAKGYIGEQTRDRVGPSTAADIVVYQTDTTDRIGTYRSIVREEFARKKSVLIVAPTVIASEDLLTTVSKGIEERVVLLHGSLTKNKQISTWKKALESEHPILIVATPHFAAIPRHDMSTIILERESSRGYNTVHKPYFDYRTFIEAYAKALGIRLILGGTFLRIETLYRRETGELADFFPLSYRIEKTAELITVDMNPKEKKESREERAKEKDEKKKFKVMSDELHSMIEYAGKKSERMFIFSARRGLSPQTVCGDCGQTVECTVCNAPIVLHQSKTRVPTVIQNTNPTVTTLAAAPATKALSEPLPHSTQISASTFSETSEEDLNRYTKDRFFLCHHCGAKRPALEGCTKCGSWKLVPLGIGLDTVAEEIKKDFPKRTLYKLDKDSVTTDKQARDMIAQFLKSKDGILLGTESALSLLPEIKYSAIASLDSLFSIPDFRINERICHIVLRMIEKTSAYLLMQTRNTSNSILKHLNSGSLSNFYREELDMRKIVNYPPFSTHIKVTVEDSRPEAAEKMKKLQDLVVKWEPLIFPAFVPTVRGKSVLHMLISVLPEDWPNPELRNILASLPKEYVVKVNPESLL